MTARVDYELHGRTYARHRRADPRIAARIHAALGDARTVLNVGAGTGSYEPEDRWLLAVEPSATMRAQRPTSAAPAIDARAEALPFDDDTFDAAMACVTIHHWESAPAGLAELRRVARGPVVVFTFELDALPAWQHEYLHEGLTLEQPRFPAIDDVAGALGGHTRVERLPTPGDCVDGFFEAFWRRPEALLDPEVRGAQSMWALLAPGVEERIVARLAVALDSGEHQTTARSETDAITDRLRTMPRLLSGKAILPTSPREQALLRVSVFVIAVALERRSAAKGSSKRVRRVNARTGAAPSLRQTVVVLGVRDAIRWLGRAVPGPGTAPKSPGPELQREFERVRAQHADDPDALREAVVRVYRDRRVTPGNTFLPSLVRGAVVAAVNRAPIPFLPERRTIADVLAGTKQVRSGPSRWTRLRQRHRAR